MTARGRADRAELAVVAERNALRADHERVMAAAAARVAEAADRADRAEQALVGERSRGETLRDRLEAAERAEAAQRDAQTVQEATEKLRQADDAHRAKGLLARLRAARRGRIFAPNTI